jgi:TRAP-type C4-dicarboxylate transport system permease large subunit
MIMASERNVFICGITVSVLFSVFFFNLCGGSLGTAATTGLLYQPRMIDDGDCG